MGDGTYQSAILYRDTDSTSTATVAPRESRVVSTTTTEGYIWLRYTPREPRFHAASTMGEPK
jgi:hypothetical protein